MADQSERVAVDIDTEELAMRMIETITGAERPAGMDAHTAMQVVDPLIRGAFRNAAISAVSYIVERLNDGGAEIKTHVTMGTPGQKPH